MALLCLHAAVPSSCTHATASVVVALVPWRAISVASDSLTMPRVRCTGGGHHYPWLVRNPPRKPIKVFMQDGDGDLNKAAGNWPLANRQMHAALEYAGCKIPPPLST